jgi:hypothetical protein
VDIDAACDAALRRIYKNIDLRLGLLVVDLQFTTADYLAQLAKTFVRRSVGQKHRVRK